MLLYRHNLYGVIPVLDYARQHIVAELGIRAHSLAILCHAYMTFVYQQRPHIGNKARIMPYIGLLGAPDLCSKKFGVCILPYTRGICRNAFALAAIPLDKHLVKVAVLHRSGFEYAFPDAVLHARQRILRQPLPVAEIALESDSRCIGSPFTKAPASVVQAMQSEIFVGVGKVFQSLGATRSQPFFGSYSVLMSPFDSCSVRLQPRIVAYNCQRLSRTYILFHRPLAVVFAVGFCLFVCGWF